MTIEAAGDIMTGGLIGRAIEPRHGEDGTGADGLTHETHCLNCRATLIGSYCHACGQHAHVHRTLGALGHDILHGVFHFEGKVWQTIPMLFTRPGQLTRRYIHGERAKFVSPLALFLFSVFLMFAVIESVGGPIGPTFSNGETVVDRKSFEAELAAAKTKVAALEANRKAALSARQPTRDIESRLAEAQSDVKGLTASLGIVGGLKGDAEISLPENLHVNVGPWSFDKQAREALKNPKLLLYKLQSSAYKFSWALIPLSLPFMWLIFAWRRQYKLYDHAVFVTYSLCFVMLLLIVMALLAATGIDANWVLLALPVHMFVQLKGAYQLRPLSALWRTFALLFVSLTVLLLFGSLLLVLGMAG